ncbi:hypothetical protein Hanom_Chr02g00152351 [Helianthus anomalus]
MVTIFQAVVLITRLDFLHVQILKARRTWSMTKLWNEDTMRRRSKDEDDRVAADHHQTPQGSHFIKIKFFTSITQGGAYVKGELVNTLPT